MNIPSARAKKAVLLKKRSKNNLNIIIFCTRSNIEESPGPETQEKISKVGLDPKYLQPAANDNKIIIAKGTY